MRKFIAIMIIICFVTLTMMSCSSDKRIDGVTYETYGLLNKDEIRNPDIQYKLVWGNIIWGCIFFETFIAPIYFFGFDIWEPVAAYEDAPNKYEKGSKFGSNDLRYTD